MALARNLLRAIPSQATIALFPALWFGCVGLAQIRLLQIQRPWSGLMWLVAVVVPVAYALGALVGREAVDSAGSTQRRRPELTPRVRNRLRLLLATCAVVGNLEEIHQFLVARTIPLFSSHIDAARFALPGGPTIILTDLLMVAAIVALVLPSRLIARDAIPELLIATFALSGYALAAGRGTILQAVVVAGIARWRYFGRPSLRSIGIALVVALAFVVAIFDLRTSQHSHDALGVELRQRVYPGMPGLIRPLVPVDLALATNMEALARIVAYFPGGVSYGHGAYDLHGFDLFFHFARDLEQVSAQLGPPWVTSTVAGPFWADGGLPLVVGGLALIGAIVGASDRIAWKTRELRFTLLAANFLFLALFGVYVNLWTQQVDWLLITPLLYLFGAAAEERAAVPQAVRALLPNAAGRPSR